MAIDSLNNNNSYGSSTFHDEKRMLEMQFATLKKLLPNISLDLEQYNHDGDEEEAFEVLLGAIEYIQYLHEALQGQQ